MKTRDQLSLSAFAHQIGVPFSTLAIAFATVSKMWAYLGMHVDGDGTAPQRRRGQQANWSAQGRVVCYQLAASIVRVRRGGYREAYDRKKAEYLARPRRGPSTCPFGQTHTDRQRQVIACGLMHAHRAAMRYAIKLLLRDIWVAWRAMSSPEPPPRQSMQATMRAAVAREAYPPARSVVLT
jgi:hypothetical protein